MIRVGGWLNANKPNMISHFVCLASNDHVTWLDPKVKVNGEKVGICDCVPSIADLVEFIKRVGEKR